MADEIDDALEERLDMLQRRAENLRDLLKDGEEITISLFDGEVAVAESFRSQFERKHPKLFGRLLSIEAQLTAGWFPYFLGLIAVIAALIVLQLSSTASLLGSELVDILNRWWLYLILPPAVLYLVSVGCGIWQRRVFRRHRGDLLALIADAGLDRDLLLVMLQEIHDLDFVTRELKLDRGPFPQASNSDEPQRLP